MFVNSDFSDLLRLFNVNQVMSMAETKIKIRPRDAARHLETEEDVIHLLRQSIAPKPAEESFRQGWQEALRGETVPIAGLWTGIEA